jgi:predicted Zn-dependent protease with MMP-like domain
MSKRNIIDLYPIEIHKNKDLLSLHNGDILLFLSPKNEIKVHKFKISKIKKRAKFSTLIAKHIDGVEKGRITLSLINDKLSGTIALPNTTYLLKTFNAKGWIGIEPKREFDDNDTVQISPDAKNLSIEKNLNTKREEQGKIFKKSRALIDGKYQIKWLVLASQLLVDTFDSKEDFELRLENVKEDMNQIYEDSKINAELDLVYYEIIDVADPSSFNELIIDMREPSEKFINLESLRHKYQVNNISLILNSSRGAAGKGNVGYCYRNTISDKSFKWTKENNIVSIFSSATLVHEIGHNMGLNHSYAQGSKGSIFEF